MDVRRVTTEVRLVGFHPLSSVITKTKSFFYHCQQEEEEEEVEEANMSDSKKAELFRIREERKNFLVSTP